MTNFSCPLYSNNVDQTVDERLRKSEKETSKLDVVTLPWCCGFSKQTIDFNRVVLLKWCCDLFTLEVDVKPRGDNVRWTARNHSLNTGPPEVIRLKDQLNDMLGDLLRRLCFVQGNPGNASMKFNSAFKQFAGTIFKLLLSAFLVFLVLCLEYVSLKPGKSPPFPSRYKIYMYVLAISIEVGGHLFHFLLYDMNKMINHNRKHKLTEEHRNHLQDLFGRIDQKCKIISNHDPVVVDHSHNDDRFVAHDYYGLRVVQYQERLGAFIMMVLGEAIIMLLIPFYNPVNAPSAYFFSICACWILFLYGIQYYDAQNFKIVSSLPCVLF